MLEGDEELPTAIVQGKTAHVSEADQAMLDFTAKMTLNSSAMSQDDVDALRRVGFSDAEIWDLVMLTALFNFMTRVADALGVQVEQDREAFAERILGGPPPVS